MCSCLRRKCLTATDRPPANRCHVGEPRCFRVSTALPNAKMNAKPLIEQSNARMEIGSIGSSFSNITPSARPRLLGEHPIPAKRDREGRLEHDAHHQQLRQPEREAVWGIQIRKYGRNPSDFDLVQLARQTEWLTGSEIESVFTDSLSLAFDNNREPCEARGSW